MNSMEGYFDDDFLERNIKGKNINRVFICGTPQMQTNTFSSLRNCGFTEDQIMFV